MTENLFTQTKTPLIDETKNYLEEYVGEGKKFKDAAELAKAKATSDAFIKQLEEEQAALRQEYFALREEYNARPALQELIDQLKNTQHTSSDNQNANDDQPPALKPEDIENLVAKKLQEAELTKKQEENYKTVQAKLKERYGESYVTHLQTQISTLGLSEDFVNDLAKNHPQVFIKTFGLDAQPKESFQTPPRGSITTQTSTPNVKRDWNYYENMRKTDYQKYWDPKTQLQMIADKATLGDSFGNS